MKPMTKRITICLLAVVSLLTSYAAGYWRGSEQSRGRVRVQLAQGTDATGASQGQSKAGIDPFFTRDNPIPDRMR